MAAATHPHTLVAIFPSFGTAVGAVRSLEDAGFDPAHVEVVGDDPRAAAEVAARTYGREGFVGGLALGTALVLAAVFLGGLNTWPVASVIGSVGVIGGFAVIGLVLGRAVEVRARDASLFAAAVRDGGAVVAVDCDANCDAAAALLHEAGATQVRDETPEASGRS
jgi:hypothetical protein